MEESSNNPSLKDKWIIDIESKLEKTSPITSSWSICKVPVKLRSVNEDAYTPHLISIGPIHHKDEKLLRMEDHKRQYLNELLNRVGKRNEILSDFYDDFLDIDEKVRACYEEPIVYGKQELAKILLHDAAFILELFFRKNKSENGEKLDDPIFTTSWMIIALQRDLALLENQIPFFVLESLFKLIDAAGFPTLNQLALEFFEGMLDIGRGVLDNKGSKESSHLLHLLYNCHLPIPKPGDSKSDEAQELKYCSAYARMRFPSLFPRAGVVFEKNSTSHGAHELEHSATSLSRAGVVFEKNSTGDMFDFQFDKGTGTFKIPRLQTDDVTESHIRNLIALEQCQRDSRHYIISYVIVMDKLIDTKDDVELLTEKGIISNELGAVDDVSKMFNKICKEVSYSNFYFKELCNKVNAYADSPWHKNKATLRRKYFNNPWSFISFVGAVAFAVLTFMQTVYTMLSYHTG